MSMVGNTFADPDRVVAEALRWIGTPYRHQASRLGVGCDCLGLVRGVWRELLGAEPESAGPYAPDWAETAADDPLFTAAARHMVQMADNTPRRGHVLLFRWRTHMAAKHTGIALDEARMIHAYQGHAVMISPLVSQWRRRIAGVFAFPAQGLPRNKH
ncbi:MAG: C40 family peptidase [Rhizobiaceae bacterium]|nr:C40 family peptidase [Rhizobiaceae bacterium]